MSIVFLYCPITLSLCKYCVLIESNSGIKKLGFTTTKETKLCHNIDEIIEFYKYMQEIRHNLEYDIDGIVLTGKKITIIFNGKTYTVTVADNKEYQNYKANNSN